MPPRKSKKDRANAPGVEVSSIDAVTTKCKLSLQKLLNNQKIGFTKGSAAGNREVYTLTGDQQVYAEAKYPIPAHLLQECSTTSYWLGASLEFYIERGKYYLVSAGIIVFQGQRDAPKVPLIRAEWACDSEFEKAAHAQPHWHVYLSTLNFEYPPSESGLVSVTEPMPFVPNMASREGPQSPVFWEKGDKFHYAMASAWQTGGKASHCHRLDPASLANWLSGCAGYIQGQLEYLAGKQSSAVAEPELPQNVLQVIT